MALALAGAMVTLALVLRQWLKLSLHVAFSVFAALVWVPAVMTTLVAILLAAGVAWSRLALGRHTWPDVWAGALVGGVAGGVYAAAHGVVGVV
jgi:membrane-associated phospholipid phosphatase